MMTVWLAERAGPGMGKPGAAAHHIDGRRVSGASRLGCRPPAWQCGCDRWLAVRVLGGHTLLACLSASVQRT